MNDTMQLVLLHHAGGSRLLYADWPDLVPPGWEIIALDAPGRGAKRDLPARLQLDHLVEHFHAELRTVLDGPYILFGHSMGGIIAYELARRLASAGDPLPALLALSACAAPCPEGITERRSAYPDDLLQDWLISAGGTAREVIRHRLVWKMFAPLLRDDLRVIESWRPDMSAGPLDCPLSVFGGRDDPLVPPADLVGWHRHSRDFRGIHHNDGGHFYLQHQPAPLIAELTRAAAQLLRF